MDDSEDDAAAMAAAMGFSSFGAQKPNKRRKFNPSTDAFIDPESPSVPVSASASASASGPHFYGYANNRVTTTGSNMVPLGIRRKNVDEIDLDMEDEEDDSRLPPGNQEPPHLTANANDGDDDDDPEPQYLDTSRPSAPIVGDPVDDLQLKIDAIVGSSADTRAPAPLSSSAVGGEQSNQGSHRGPQRNMSQGGRSETKWWESYYDPAFITNPWEQLEKANGLEPLGDWVSWEEAKAART